MNVLALLLIGFVFLAAPQQQTEREANAELRQVIRDFSEATMEEGPGWEGHAAFLHADFTRCYNGGDHQERAKHVEGVRDWWEAGNRVKEGTRETQYMKITSGVAIVRQKVKEKHIYANGNITDAFNGHVTQVWIKVDDEWEMLSIDIVPAE